MFITEISSAADPDAPMQHKIDSIKALVKTNPNNYDAWEGLGNLLGSVNFKLTTDAYRKAVIASKKCGNMREYSYSLILLGNVLGKNLKFLDAIDTIKKGIEVAEKYGNTANLIYGYSQLGKIYKILGRYREAGKYFSKSYHILRPKTIADSVICSTRAGRKATESEKRLFIVAATMYLNYSDYLENTGKTDLAVAMTKNAIPITSRFESMAATEGIANMSLGNYEFNRRNYAAAIKYYKTSIDVLKKRESYRTWRIGGFGINQKIAKCYEKLGFPAAAREVLLSIAPYPNTPFYVLTGYYQQLAQLDIKLTKKAEALEILHKFDSQTASIDNQSLLGLYKTYMMYYESIGNFRTALNYFDKVEKLRQSMQMSQAIQSVASHLLILQFNKKAQELEINRAKNEENTIRLRSAAILQRVMFSGFSILIFLGIMIYRSNKSRGKLLSGLADINKNLVEMNQNLVEVNKTKDRFFSIMAKDLRQPMERNSRELGFLNSNLKTLEDAEKRSLLAKIKCDAFQTQILLENLLTWSRLQMGRIPYNPEIINPGMIVQNVISTENKAASAKKIALENTVGEDETVFYDAGFLLVLLRNLISNAIKYSLCGGKVTIGMKSKSEQGRIIFVKDEGVGIPSEKLPLLFNLNSNFATTGTAGEKGTGLGLVICQGFIQKAGGEISASSEIGKGTEFDIFIPDRRND